MKRANAQYWACQIAGWGAYSGIGLTTGVLDNGWRPSIIIGFLLFFLYSIGLTHLLRAEIHRRHWTSLPVHRTLVRLAASSVAIGGSRALWSWAFIRPSKAGSAYGVSRLPLHSCSWA